MSIFTDKDLHFLMPNFFALSEEIDLFHVEHSQTQLKKVYEPDELSSLLSYYVECLEGSNQAKQRESIGCLYYLISGSVKTTDES